MWIWSQALKRVWYATESQAVWRVWWQQRLALHSSPSQLWRVRRKACSHAIEFFIFPYHTLVFLGREGGKGGGE